jgi:hypothetical protein
MRFSQLHIYDWITNLEIYFWGHNMFLFRTETTRRSIRVFRLRAKNRPVSANHSYAMFRAVFWFILPCKMIVDRRFRGAYCLHHQGWVNIILAAVRTWNLTHSYAIFRTLCIGYAITGDTLWYLTDFASSEVWIASNHLNFTFYSIHSLLRSLSMELIFFTLSKIQYVTLIAWGCFNNSTGCMRWITLALEVALIHISDRERARN